MTDLIEDYLREVERALQVDAERKSQIIGELRSHLHEKVTDLQQMDASRSRHDIERHVIADFGNPRDLAVGYGAEGTMLLQNQAGETLLRIGRAVGKGTVAVGRAVGRGGGTFLRWLAVGVAGLVVLAVVVGIWAFYEVRPVVQEIVEENVPYAVYEFSCDATGCPGDPMSQSFFIHQNAKDVRFELFVHGPRDSTSNATVLVVVADPFGTVKYNRSFAERDHRHTSENVVWGPVTGDWTISFRFEGIWQGDIDAEVFTTGVPRSRTGGVA